MSSTPFPLSGFSSYFTNVFNFRDRWLSQEYNRPHLLDLPDELLQHILLYLSKKEVAQLSLVNKKFNDLSKDSAFWAPVLKEIKGNLMVNMSPLEIQDNPYRAVKEHFQAEIRLQNKESPKISLLGTGVSDIPLSSSPYRKYDRYNVDYSEHTHIKYLVAFSDQRRVALGLSDGAMTILDIVSEKQLIKMEPIKNGDLNYGNFGRGYKLTTCGNHAIISGCRHVYARDIDTQKTWELPYGEHHDAFNHITHLVAYADHLIAAGFLDEIVKVWDLDLNADPKILPGHKGSITCIAFLNEHSIATGCDDQSIRVWDLATQGVTWLKKLPNTPLCITRLDDHRLVSTSSDLSLEIWDLDSDKNLPIINGGNVHEADDNEPNPEVGQYSTRGIQVSGNNMIFRLPGLVGVYETSGQNSRFINLCNEIDKCSSHGSFYAPFEILGSHGISVFRSTNAMTKDLKVWDLEKVLTTHPRKECRTKLKYTIEPDFKDITVVGSRVIFWGGSQSSHLTIYKF